LHHSTGDEGFTAVRTKAALEFPLQEFGIRNAKRTGGINHNAVFRDPLRFASSDPVCFANSNRHGRGSMGADSGKNAAIVRFHFYLIRFDSDWRVLLSHLILFGYIYPGERARIPAAIVEDLVTRLRSETRTSGPERLCRGTLLSRQQYLVDVQQ
jgi:hypothetical protein